MKNILYIITLTVLASITAITIGENINAHRSLVNDHTQAAKKCPKACIVEVQAMIDITPSVPANSNGKKQVTGYVISTVGNQAGIEDGDTCAVFEMPQNDGTTKTCIVCSSGLFFDNVCGQEGSATGTPGFLMYKNYIGSYYHPKATSGLLGADRRTTYCISDCK